MDERAYEYLQVAMEKLRKLHGGYVSSDEYDSAYLEYRNYFGDTILSSPTKGFMECWNWTRERREEFENKIEEYDIITF